ncbi:MAG TPA: BTAD domain-containing putative transcriptional regulator [Solirubrobacteraceae bacterium]|nr:BTAD domain-containing putative transcriptional regulator [Solirubrobacteraceae bacterium]
MTGGPVQQTSTAELATAAEVRVKLLGGFTATRDGAPLDEARWRLRKGRDLVKMLALAPGHRLHREQLMDALWPELDPAAAANNLNQVVHAARRVLGADAIEVREELLRLGADVDVDEFEQAAAHARATGSATAYRAALALYGGELLPENRYEDWARERREQLEDLRMELEEELGRLASGRATIGVIPTRASSFIGREHELAELTALLRSSRLLTLAGAGGAGKTRLALELARRSEDGYGDGAALVELAGVREGGLVVNAAAVALEVASLPGRSPLEGIVDYLSSRSALLVLDNCEHLLAASAALCDELLRAAPGLTILATTREPLRVDGEVVFRVPSLGIPDPEGGDTADQLMRYESVRLLADRAAAAVPGFAVDADNGRDVARICFRLDGMPLALELAAARLGGLGTSALAERLDDRFRLLRTDSRPAPTRQQTLLATLQWSHDLLNTPEQVLLRRLSLFAGGFDLAAAEVVCVDAQMPVETIADVLARLVEKSLVDADGTLRTPRYQLQESVRLYAGERLAEAGERARFARCHARWALALVEQERGGVRLDRETANLRAAHHSLPPEERLRYCSALLPLWLRRIDLEGAHKRCTEALQAAPEATRERARTLLAIAAIDYRAGMLACGEAHVQEADEIARELAATELRWQTLQRFGEFAVARDEPANAEKRFEQARRLAAREGLAPEQAASVYSLGVARRFAGDLEGSEQLISSGAAALRLLEGEQRSILSPLNISETRPGNLAPPATSWVVFEETLQPFVEIPLELTVPYAQTNQAAVARLRGEPQQAQRLLDEADGLFERAGDPRGRAGVLVGRAYLALTTGDPRHAQDLLELALEIRDELGDRRGAGLAMVGLGLVGIERGDHETAERHLGRARELFRRAGDRWGLVSSLWRTAELAIARGHLDDASDALAAARTAVAPTERKNWIHATIGMQAEVAALRGEREHARAMFEQVREAYLAAGDAAAAAAVDRRAQTTAKKPQSRRKGSARTNARATTTNQRRHR